MIMIKAIFLLFLLLLLIPVAILLLQIVVSIPLFHKRQPGLAYTSQSRPSIAVLVPAHNESSGISATLDVINAQLQAGDRLLVVADNCTDDTAELAAAAGAVVIERNNMRRRGKGYALDYGVRYLEYSPPQVLVIIDADCMVHANSLEILAKCCLSADRPVQALYLMFSPNGAGLKTRVAEFAWMVKNWARAAGYQRLGLPCQLMGTGMAFPWHLIQKAELASGHIVEDLKLGLDFATIGYAPQFCLEALVTSVFPARVDGMQSQRTRWEHGHLGMVMKEGPRLLLKALCTWNIELLALVLDMLVPPLALLTLLVTLLAIIGALLPWPLLGGLAIANLLLLIVAVLLAWFVYGRGILTLGNLAYAPIYALSKLPLYLRFMVKRQTEWVRSRRDG